MAAQQTLGYANAVTNYCNRVSSFMQNSQLMYRDARKVLAGDETAVKYVLSPLNDVKHQQVDEGDPRQSINRVPDTIPEEDRRDFQQQISSLRETLSKLKQINVTLFDYVQAKQYQNDSGAQGKTLLTNGAAGLTELSALRDAVAQHAQKLGQASERVTIQGDPRREKIYAMQEDLQNAKQFTSYLIDKTNSGARWSPEELARGESLFEQVRASISRHSGMHLEDFEKNRGDFYGVFYKSAQHFLEDGTRVLKAVQTNGHSRAFDVNFVANDLNGLVGEYNMAISP